MASSTLNTAASARKQHKAKRSLRKTPRHQKLADKESLAIDLSKPEMDAIFTGLFTGQLENPQMAANKVYALALDALEKTLCEGLDEFCRDIRHNSASNSDNPLAPLISKFIPKDQVKINSIRDDIKTKIGKAKHTVTDKLTSAFEADAADGNMLGRKGQMTADAIREVFEHAEDIKLPGLHHCLSKERLSELSELIKLPIQDDGVKRFTITNLPNKYRFSFGTPSSSSTTSEPQSVENTISFSTDSCDNSESGTNSAESVEDIADEILPEAQPAQDIAEDSEYDNSILPEDNQSENANESNNPEAVHISGRPIIPPLKDIVPNVPISPEMLVALKDGAEDCVATANEVTEILKEMAIQITEAAMQAYQEEHFTPSLADILKEDPETENDAELLAFIQELESGADAEDAADDGIGNDELTSAFGKLLDDFDE